MKRPLLSIVVMGSLVILLAVCNCAPPLTRASLPPAPAPPHPATLPARLPDRVDVVLDRGVGSVDSITFTDGTSARHTATSSSSGISVDGITYSDSVKIHGPVQIGDARHNGDIVFERSGLDDRLRAVASLPLDEYIAGVLSAELSLWSAEPHELRALAVAARTFAVRTLLTRGSGSRLTDGILDQAYRGTYVPPPGSEKGRAVRARLDEAVADTRGLVLARGALLDDVRYHASCGGHTADLVEVFADEPDIRIGSIGAICEPCKRRALAEITARAHDPRRPLGWLVQLTPADLARVASAADVTPPLRRLGPARRDASGRWIRARVLGSDGTAKEISMNELRSALGFKLLPGTRIIALRPDTDQDIGAEGIMIEGRGRGHGVGLCQESLRDYAHEGWSYEELLAHYLPGSRLVRLEGPEH